MENNNLPDLTGKVYEYKQSKIRVYPQHKNRASECGSSCERYLVLSRTRWQDRVPHGPELQFIFDGGNMIEDMAIRELSDAGFQIIEQQRAFEWPALQLTGHLDCKVLYDSKAYPVEIKGLQHHDFVKLNTIQDFHNSKKPWIRKYPAQLTMYMLNTGHEIGAFYLKDKLNYQPKTIWVELDYDYAESICKKLERINAHIAKGTLPEEFDEPDACQMCGFLHVCLPEIKATAIEISEDENLISKLERRSELEEVFREYSALDREIKKAIEGKERAIIGDYLITGKWVERAGYAVSASRYWLPKIGKLVPQKETA